jgi:hypothetical protein
MRRCTPSRSRISCIEPRNSSAALAARQGQGMTTMRATPEFLAAFSARDRQDSCGSRVHSAFRPRALRGRQPMHAARLGLGLASARQRSVNHDPVTSCSVGPWDRGNPCREARGSGRGGGAAGEDRADGHSGVWTRAVASEAPGSSLGGVKWGRGCGHRGVCDAPTHFCDTATHICVTRRIPASRAPALAHAFAKHATAPAAAPTEPGDAPRAAQRLPSLPPPGPRARWRVAMRRTRPRSRQCNRV